MVWFLMDIFGQWTFFQLCCSMLGGLQDCWKYTALTDPVNQGFNVVHLYIKFKWKLYINNIQKCCRVLWAQTHLRWMAAQWKRCAVVWQVRISNFFGRKHVKRKKDRPDCYQRKVQRFGWSKLSVLNLFSLTFCTFPPCFNRSVGTQEHLLCY